MSLKTRFEGEICFLEFDHGKANEMGRDELGELEILAEQLVEHEVRCLISFSRRLSKRGTPIFISGANVTERGGWSEEEIRTHVRRQRACLARIRQLPLFHLTVVNGVAFGWGCEWLLTADYRIGTESARFALPETGLGIIPGAGGSVELAGLIGLPQALRLAITGETIDSAEALRIGLIQERQVNIDEGLRRAEALAALVKKKSPTSIAALKWAALAAVGEPEPTRREIEASAYERCLESGDAAIGRAHFTEIRRGERPPWGPLSLS